MESLEPSAADSQIDDSSQPVSKKRKLDHLNASTESPGRSLSCFSEIPPRARAKQQRPRYPHLHSGPPSLSPLPNTPFSTHAGAESASESQTQTAACVAYKLIALSDHEHAVDTKFGLLLQQVRDVQAETERCRAETDRRRVERERELERSFERRRVQREREFEITNAQRDRELERGFSQCEQELQTLFAQREKEMNNQREEEHERRLLEREKEMEKEFGLQVAKVEGELGSVKKELLTEEAKSARTVVELTETQKRCQELGANLEQLTSTRGGLERALKGAMERLLEADQELAGIRKHRDTLLETLSRVVVDEKEEIRTLRKHLQSYDTPASGHTMHIAAHAAAVSDYNYLMAFAPSSCLAAPSYSADDGEPSYTTDPCLSFFWRESSSAISCSGPCDLPLALAGVRAEHIALVQALHAKHESAANKTSELLRRLYLQGFRSDEALRVVEQELVDTRAKLEQVEESQAMLEKGADNMLLERTRLKNLIAAQKGFEQEARRSQRQCTELDAKLVAERKDAVEMQKKLTSELEGTRAAAQGSLEKAKDRKRIFDLLLAAARGETEELREQLEKLNSAVGPQRQHPQPERGSARIHRSTTREPSVPPVEVEPLHGQREATAADLQGDIQISCAVTEGVYGQAICDQTSVLFHACIVIVFTNCVTVPDIDFQRRALRAEAALVRFHFGAGIVSSTLREMLKDLKWPRKVKIEEDNDYADNHDLWDVADAYRGMLDKHSKAVEAVPDKENHYGSVGCPLCPPDTE
ncbi:hypothetical protein D9619_012433 [Psilocybe cf. subviscida]|uniref:Uncharacterized protein n=1 Tax=Psilocybe cf. subviscida TaxID=2480587 RepID=A0A8H5AR77_9AGAR|nr:hypothetical protein D9619_012433 [Psilocybe cf. subviscida]